MTDVAREAGCSQATVSFVLNRNDSIRISPQMQERVFAAARALGYSAAAAPIVASEVEFGTGEMIGFAVDQLSTSPEAIVAIEGARQAAWASGNVILVAQTQSDPKMEPKTLRALTGKDVAALVYMTIFTREIEPPAYLYELDIPVVLLNCYSVDHAFPAVVPGEIAGGQSATEHLIRHGHTRIATIMGEPHMSAAQDRLKGYRRALATADIPFDADLVADGNWSASAGYDATLKLLALKQPPTAIFCQNDRMAIGSYEALKEAGLSIPEDMSVVGYDDEEISRHLHPRLTTSILPHRAMGQWAIEQLEARRPSKERYPIAKLECALVERDSVAPPKARR
jgi:LacI family transcriptional regulator